MLFIAITVGMIGTAADDVGVVVVGVATVGGINKILCNHHWQVSVY